MRARGWACVAVEIPWIEAIGVNSQAQLAEAEAVLQEELAAAGAAGGVLIEDPIPYSWRPIPCSRRRSRSGLMVVFGPGVHGAGARILPFCHLEGVAIEAGAQIGPFARFRPGEIGAGAKVELRRGRRAPLEPGAKANHLSYIGDARVGAKANIGAGTITCNYDGFAKHRTDIGAGAFIGSNTALVAPLTIGDGAFVGAGSTINRDVPPGSRASHAAGRPTSRMARPGCAPVCQELALFGG